MVKEQISWIKYCEKMRLDPVAGSDPDINRIAQMLSIRQLTTPLFNHSIPWVYLLDYVNCSYISASDSVESITGFKPDDFLNGGLQFTFEHYQRNHLQIFNEEIFPDRLNFLKKIPVEQHPNYIFSFSFQFNNHKGKPVNLLQRNQFIKSDAHYNPLISFGTVTNIDHFKAENQIVQIIEKIDPLNPFAGREVVFKKSYFLHKEDRLFTRREKELLPHLAAGLCTKEIADKLCISEYTVTNHRRNMMLKTGSLNVTQLVCFALAHCII